MARDPKAEVEISAHSRNLGTRLAEARAKFAKFGAEVRKNALGGFGKDFWGKGGAQLVGNLGSSAVQNAASFAADQARAVFDYNDALVRLQITASKTPEDMAAFSTVVRKASEETGLGRRQILEAANAYVALTGDMDTATSSTALWARVAQATNTPVSDIARTAAALSQQLGITAVDGEAAFSALAAGGKAGAVELKDFAGLMSQIAPQWAMFKGGAGLKGLREMSTTLQIVTRGFGGDAVQSVTGLQSLLTSLVKNSGRFSKAGIKIFDVDPKTHTKTMRGVLDIVGAIGDSKLMKDPTKLEKAFGRVEAYRAFLQLVQNKDELDRIYQASQDTGVIQRDLATYTASTAGRLNIAWEKTKNLIADAFTPERIDKFAAVIERLLPKLGKMADFFGKAGDVLGSIEGAGESIRGWVSGNGDRDTAGDRLIAENGITGLYQLNHGMNPATGHMYSPDDAEAAVAAAKERLQVSEGFNAAKAQIVAGEDEDHHVTPEAIRRAFAAKYNTMPQGGASQGAFEAGGVFLQNAGIKDPVAVAMQQNAGLIADARQLSTNIAALTVAITALGLKPTTVKADGKAIVDVHRGSPTHRSRPGL